MIFSGFQHFLKYIDLTSVPTATVYGLAHYSTLLKLNKMKMLKPANPNPFPPSRITVRRKEEEVGEVILAKKRATRALSPAGGRTRKG